MDATKEKVKKVQEIARERGVTAYRIAQNVSTSVTTVSAILSGKNENPKNETLDEILLFLSKDWQGQPPKNYESESFRRLIENEVIPKLDTIINFIEYVYPEYLLDKINREKESLNDDKEIKKPSTN